MFTKRKTNTLLISSVLSTAQYVCGFAPNAADCCMAPCMYVHMTGLMPLAAMMSAVQAAMQAAAAVTRALGQAAEYDQPDL